MTERQARWARRRRLALASAAALAVALALAILPDRAQAQAADSTPAGPDLPVHFTAVPMAQVALPDPSTAAGVEAMHQPPLNPVWQTVDLPDATAREAVSTDTEPAANVMRWYRLLRPHPTAADPAGPALGLYIARASGGPVQVLLRQRDGAWLAVFRGDDQRFEQWNRPLLVPLPPEALATLAPGQPLELLVGSSSNGRGSYAMSTLWVGPLEALRWRYDWRSLVQLQAPMATSTAILIVGLFALGVWWGRRHEQAYLLFALAAGVWCFRNLHYTIDLPRTLRSWQWFWWATHASLSWVLLLVYRFALRFDGRRHRAMERFLLGGVLLASAISMPLWPHIDDVLLLQHGVDAIVALTVTGYMSWLSWHGGGPELRAITVASWIGQVFGLHDLLLVAGRLTAESIYLLPYAPLVVFASFLYATQRRYVQAIEQVEGANQRLEARLREREAELLANHARLRDIEREQTLLLERQRLMADMHDGIGSTLMSSLILLEQGRIDREGTAAVVRECVDDLRLVIDSLEPIDNDLSTLLATLRYRLGRRMDAAGVQLEWVMDDLPALPWLTAPDALQVLRLLQEVLTNVLKHAQARHVRMSAQCAGSGDVEVRIEDDGCGYDAEAAARQGGRGLGNLRLRARQLRARLEVATAPGRGTVVRLLLPVQRPAA